MSLPGQGRFWRSEPRWETVLGFVAVPLVCTRSILSIGVEKSFDKTQHSFPIKSLQKVGLEGTDCSIIQAR